MPANDPIQTAEERPANKLADSHSPYLAAHAHDPVRWRTWGPAAFKRAQRLDRPMLISIGYQSCHWCHVMHRESFADADLAGFINRHFVPVKVDRELRPDVDAFYMSHLTATTGSGGWPMTVFATPEGVPFYSGTYFPRQPAGPGVPGFADVLDLVLRAWKLERAATDASAAETLAFLSESFGTTGDGLSGELVERAAAALRGIEDPDHGGIGGAPKFPQAPATTFLLGYHRLSGEAWPLEMAARWVRGMLRGGCFDQLAGGVFRYSTDASWTLPHFEKMLYDQGLLLSTLADLHSLAPDTEFERAALLTADFLEKRLARPEGGFFSSLDAETGGIEGGTYLWTRDELAAHLAPEELAFAEDRSLFEPVPGAGSEELVIVRRDGRAGDAAAVDALFARLAEARDARPQPAVIENVIVAWNAIAARGLIEAGAAFSSAKLTEMGLATLDHLLRDAVSHGEVLAALDDESVRKVRLLESSSALAAACIAAARHADGAKALTTAGKLHARARDTFTASDGRLLASSGDKRLPLVPCDQADAPTPSGAALFAENAIALAEATGDERLLDDARGALGQFTRAAAAVPALAGHALSVAAGLASISR